MGGRCWGLRISSYVFLLIIVSVEESSGNFLPPTILQIRLNTEACPCEKNRHRQRRLLLIESGRQSCFTLPGFLCSVSGVTRQKPHYYDWYQRVQKFSVSKLQSAELKFLVPKCTSPVKREVNWYFVCVSVALTWLIIYVAYLSILTCDVKSVRNM